MSTLFNRIKMIERELNETHNIKRRFPEFPLRIEFPRNVVRNGWGVFYQKNRGFIIWGPNHYTRASLVTPITPIMANANYDPAPRYNATAPHWLWWNIKVSNGTGNTMKQDTILKGTPVYDVGSGSTARVDVTGGYQRQFSGTYSAGALPENYVIREVGLFMKSNITTTISGQSFTEGQEYMVARLSESDGDFSPYTVNNAIPLTINWIIQWTL